MELAKASTTANGLGIPLVGEINFEKENNPKTANRNAAIRVNMNNMLGGLVIIGRKKLTRSDINKTGEITCMKNSPGKTMKPYLP